MPIKRVKKVKKTKESVKTVAKAKKKGQAQAQTNIQKVNIRIGGEHKGNKKEEEQKSIVVAPTVAPVFHTRTGLSEAHFMPPYPQVKMGNPVLMEQAIKKEQYINNHSGVVVGGNQNQRLLTPSDVFAHSIQPITNFSTVKQPADTTYEKVEKEDHKEPDPKLEEEENSDFSTELSPRQKNPIYNFFKKPEGEKPEHESPANRTFSKGKTGPRPEGGKAYDYYKGLIDHWNQQQQDIDSEPFVFSYRDTNGKRQRKGIEELRKFVREYGLE
jgi:hypothetical protein